MIHVIIIWPSCGIYMYLMKACFQKLPQLMEMQLCSSTLATSRGLRPLMTINGLEIPSEALSEHTSRSNAGKPYKWTSTSYVTVIVAMIPSKYKKCINALYVCIYIYISCHSSVAYSFCIKGSTEHCSGLYLGLESMLGDASGSSYQVSRCPRQRWSFLISVRSLPTISHGSWWSFEMILWFLEAKYLDMLTPRNQGHLIDPCPTPKQHSANSPRSGAGNALHIGHSNTHNAALHSLMNAPGMYLKLF